MSSHLRLSYITYDAKSEVPDLRSILSTAGDVFTDTLFFQNPQGIEGIALGSLDPESLKDQLMHADEIVKVKPARSWKYPTVELRLGWPEVHHEALYIDINGRQLDYIVWQIYCVLKRVFDNLDLLRAARGSTLAEELSIDRLFLCSLKHVGRDIWQPFFKITRSGDVPGPHSPPIASRPYHAASLRRSADEADCEMAIPRTSSRKIPSETTGHLPSNTQQSIPPSTSTNDTPPVAASTQDVHHTFTDIISDPIPDAHIVSPLLASLNSLTPEEFEAMVQGLTIDSNNIDCDSQPSCVKDGRDTSGVEPPSRLSRSPFQLTTPPPSTTSRAPTDTSPGPAANKVRVSTPQPAASLWSVTPRPGFSLMFFPLWVDPTVASQRSILPLPAIDEVAKATASSYISKDYCEPVHSPHALDFNLSDWVNVTTPERVAT
ncbi:hypothetical protein SISNIDRAFT_471077 [Sistotremastrum niveocremeum HHB9708]|uniref:Uncharacterized protein n=1 Tax=Sistotremastrum niveocremeum HHB9708 TaxID=1314777 RepID=A0A164N3S7_9AGAM|nr:hypothetical protein SISNIDRAFT_471077 [Sistotremastrum niveocremeum HHB9708]